MGFLPIFLALGLFLMLWAIVVSQFLAIEKRKIQAMTGDLSLASTLAAVDARLNEEGAQELRSLRARMLRYNKLINSYPYKIVAGIIGSKKF